MVARILRTTSLLNVLALGTFDVSAEEAEELMRALCDSDITLLKNIKIQENSSFFENDDMFEAFV